MKRKIILGLALFAMLFYVFALAYAGTSTANLSLYKPSRYEVDWDTTVNNNMDIIDTALGTFANSDGSLKADIIGTAELDDAADTPVAGQCLVVAADTTKIEYTACAGGGGGEANTASNTGSAGTGLFKQKTLVDLEFYKIASSNALLTVALSGTDYLNLTVNQGSIDHGSLAGLGDDDHTQYLLAAGTRALTGNWDVGAFTITGTQFISDIAIGTAPLVVTSTTKVTNLNVDQVDNTGLGTLTDEKVCTYEATGTIIDCNEAETGTGSIVRATSPTFVTPLLGTPTSGTLTNASGLPVTSGLIAGNWDVFYSNGSGALIELSLGADGTFLMSNGAAAAPTFETPAGTGDVTSVGDCVSGACLDGSADGGKYVRLYDGDSNYTEINNDEANQAADLKWVLPDANGTAGQVLEIAAVAGNVITLEWDDDGGAGATAWDDLADPDNDGLTTIDFNHASENTTLTNIYDAAGSFFKIYNTAADLANETSLLGLEYTADADDQATFILATDNDGDTMWKLGVNGRMTIGPSATDYILPTARGAANTYLRDNGAGAVTFSALSGIGPANFTASTDFGDVNTDAGGALRFGADSIDNSIINWGNITYLDDEGAIDIAAYAARTAFASGDSMLILEAGVGIREIDYDDLPGAGASSLAATLAVGADANDLDITSMAKLEGVDVNTYIDMDTTDIITTKGNLIPSANGADDLGTDALEYNNAWFDGTLEADTITEGGNAVYNSTDDLFLKLAGDVATPGTYDFGSAGVILEIPNAAADLTLAGVGQVGVDSVQTQFAYHDGTREVAVPSSHYAEGGFSLNTVWDVDHELKLMTLNATRFPDGIVILNWRLWANEADPTTEFQGDFMYCDDPGVGAFPGANPILIDVMDSTTGNSSEADMSNSDLASGVIPSGKVLYILMDVDPVDATVIWHPEFEYYIPES